MKPPFLLFLWAALQLSSFPGQRLYSQRADSLREQPYYQIPDSLFEHKQNGIIRTYLRKEIWILSDTSGQLNIKEVASPAYAGRFRPNSAEGLPMPPDQITWLRLRLQGNDRPYQYYRLFLPQVSRITLFEQDQPGEFTVRKTGLSIPNGIGSLSQYDWNIFELTFAGRETKTLYLRLEQSGAMRFRILENQINAEVHFISTEASRSNNFRELILDALFDGWFFFIALSFLLLYLTTREKYLVWGSLAYFGFIIWRDNFFLANLVSTGWCHIFKVLGMLLGVMPFLQFFRELLDFKNSSPLWNKIYYWAIILLTIDVLLLNATIFILPASDFPQLANFIISSIFPAISSINKISSVGIIFISSLFIFWKVPKARNSFLVLVIVGMTSMIVIHFLTVTLELISYYQFYRIAERIIMGLLGVAFIWIIGHNYRQFQDERTNAIKDKLALQQNLNHELETQVQARTEELQEKNQQLATRNEQLIRLDQEKNNLINIVAHDLGSPLASIKMYSGIVQKAREKLSAKQREYLDGISTTAQRSVEMIRRILDVNTIDQNGLQLELQQTDVLPILTATVVDFQGLAGRKDIKIITELPEEPVILNIDPAAFRQVIDNLVSNAIKFSPAGKTVAVGLATEQDHTTRLYVRDQGPGIAPEDMPKLFQRYARLSAQPTAGETSTGLGLAIVKQYVEAMGGQVWAENNEEEGATFWVEL